ncbi:hypothetical protein ACLB2K_012668 [Fragaria x ananassa]
MGTLTLRIEGLVALQKRLMSIYSFGVILLVFLTGRNAFKQNQAAEMWESVVSYVKEHACDGQFQTIMDPKIIEESGGEDEEAQLQQLHDFLTLALFYALERKVQ